MRMNDASQATGVRASQDRNPLEGRLWQGGKSRSVATRQLCPKKIPARLRHGGRKLAQPRRAAPGNRDWRLPGWGRRAWRPRSTAHRESGLSICGQTHCRAPTKPRLVLIATSLPISAVGFRPKTFSVVAAERTSRYFPAAVLRDLYVPSNYGDSVISATALGLSGLGLALWPRLLLHHGPAHRTRLCVTRAACVSGACALTSPSCDPTGSSVRSVFQGFFTVSTWSSASSPVQSRKGTGGVQEILLDAGVSRRTVRAHGGR